MTEVYSKAVIWWENCTLLKSVAIKRGMDVGKLHLGSSSWSWSKHTIGSDLLNILTKYSDVKEEGNVMNHVEQELYQRTNQNTYLCFSVPENPGLVAFTK
jgi:hypothetical protein